MFKHLLEFLKCKFGKRTFGLLPLPKDERDFNLGMLGWEPEYQPKNSKIVITSTLPIKTQSYNTCTFNSRAVGKEMDEGMILSVPFLVKIAKKWGMISGNGFANLRTSELITQKLGICEDSLLPEDHVQSWEEYSKDNVTQEQFNNASVHKSASFWAINNRFQAWKALDEGRTVRVGSIWKTSMNDSMLRSPFILNYNTGFTVGGHAFILIGYDRNHDGFDVFICQNSFGSTYGDNGRMYISKEDLDKQISVYGAFVDMDLPKDTAKLIKEHNGKLLKDVSNPDDVKKSDVYLIKDGKKWLFPDMATLYANGYTDEQIVDDEGSFLKELPIGGTLNFWDSPNVMTIKALILRAPHLKYIFEKYFSELFQK